MQRKSFDMSVALQPQLAFNGNLQEMNMQVSISTTNAIISRVGCFLLFVTSLGILV